MKILLVEDDARFARSLTVALRRCGHEVEHAPTAAAALSAGRSDLVLLDLGLPDEDGIAMCTRLRARGGVAIIVLTARGEEKSRVAGLRAGADDYLVKPFGFAELEARMEAVLRRVRPRPTGVHVVGELTVDLDRHQAYLGSDPLTLSRKEFQLLAVLAGEPGVVHRRERLLLDVWNTSWRGTSRTLDVHISMLRPKIAAAGKIETVRGVGFRLIPRAEPVD